MTSTPVVVGATPWACATDGSDMDVAPISVRVSAKPALRIAFIELACRITSVAFVL
jgi:hypothetical protein